MSNFKLTQRGFHSIGTEGKIWKTGDWVIFDLQIGQIKEIHEENYVTFTDGSVETSGRLFDHFRPMTLTNKIIAENFDYHYMELRKIDGEVGFNYPDICRYFCQLALNAMDEPIEVRNFYDKAIEFVQEAKEYHRIIQGVNLFRKK